MKTIVVACICAGTVTSCTAISVNDLPQPGRSYSDGYAVVLEFENVLNLPDRAKVVMDGTTIGIVDSVQVHNQAVDVTALIDEAVKIPVNSRAVLQQATVLGDIYVAIERGSRESGVLGDDGRIPLAQTTSPPQLEDTIANLAQFVTSGSIQRIQSTIIRLNNVTPESAEEIRAIASRVSVDLKDLSDNVNTVDQWLEGLAGTGRAMADGIPKFEYWFSKDGMIQWDRLSTVGISIGTLVPSVGSIYTGGYWLVPLLNSLGIAVGEVQQSKWAIEGEYRPWRELFREMFLPADKYPAMNITSVQTSDGRDITGNVEDVLRMLGAIP